MPVARRHMGKRKNRQTHRSYGGRLARAKSALNLQILCRRFAPVRDFLVFDDLSLIETTKTSSLDCRNVDKHIFAAALRLNEPIPFLRIEPLHSALGHYLLQIDRRRGAIVARPEGKGARLPPVACTRGAGPPTTAKWSNAALPADHSDLAHTCIAKAVR
jgi:hypothetical protein